LKFWRDQGENNTVIELPSGNQLLYHDARIVGDEILLPNAMLHTTTRAWGGSLVENIIQSISRDILGEAILLTEDRGQDIGLSVVLHCHDETVGVAPIQHGQQALDISIAALKTVPTWAEGLPLNAEGSLMSRYGKG